MVVRSILCGILSRWNTASLRLIQDSRRSPSIRHICGYFFLNKKQETCSCIKIEMLTSYDGIIHIRLKGRSSITSSQPANELPCFYQICNVSLLNHRQTYYSASGEIFKCDFLVHFYPLSFHDQGQRKRPPDSGESHNATQKNR